MGSAYHSGTRSKLGWAWFSPTVHHSSARVRVDWDWLPPVRKGWVWLPPPVPSGLGYQFVDLDGIVHASPIQAGLGLPSHRGCINVSWLLMLG